jgi:predicted unusual protein kinase regulating ubiquinone biosynthesis (AarF/ABC1/UbiB family)
MPPTIAELIDALPPEAVDEPSASDELAGLADRLSRRQVPVGQVTRTFALGTLQAKIAAGYLAWWLTSFASSDDAAAARLNRVHLRAALRVISGMGYLRGAAMKVGQLLATYPDVVPAEFAAILGRLHFEAPPMHLALLKEMLRRELGRDPETVFETFDRRAFAAASLGQVHRARLRSTGETVAVKVQYPGIDRTIDSDLRLLKAASFPMRLGGDWESLKEQFEDIRVKLTEETDYLREAEHMAVARSAFGPEDEIVVPGVNDELTTRRVLTMQLLPGEHLGRFLESGPGAERRDRHGRQIALAALRLSYGKHLVYADPHPGNYLFMPDGRLGLLDFGCCHRYTAEELEYLRATARACFAGSPEAVRAAVARAADLTPRQQGDQRRLELLEAYARWVWEPILHEGPFDFGDRRYFQRGMDLYTRMLKRRYVRSLPVNTWLGRNFFGVRAMLTHLGARVDLGALVRRESAAGAA